MMALDRRIRGNVPALVTPCDDTATPDVAAIARLVEHVIGAGADALNVLGTSGEFALVPPRHRRKVISTMVAAAADRVPVICGCGRPSVEETVGELREAADLGVAAALVAPSYYFPLSDAEAVRFVSMLAEASPIPILYYHYPQMTGGFISVAAIVALARTGAIAGIKDSSADVTFFARLCAETVEFDDFRIFVGGSAFLLGALAHGADGVIGALGNFGASLDHAVLDAFAAGDMPAARTAQARVVRAVDAIFRRTAHNPAAVAKAILSARGICSDAVFPPLEPLTGTMKRELIDRLPSLGIAMA